jgi:hypothetical protein
VLAATTRADLTAFTITTPFGPNREEGRALVRDLRSGSGPLAAPAGTAILVGGGAADVSDVVDGVAADFPRTAAFIIVTTYLVLFALLRSVVLPAKALLMNALSITASFGALVWIFQDGNLSALLGFRPVGFVETTQPVILFCVLFGLSMDYEVFLLSRMKEVWDTTGDNTEAVARGLERSGRIVTSAALIVVVVAGSFAFADIVLIKALGLGVAIAVALDATVVRACWCRLPCACWVAGTGGCRHRSSGSSRTGCPRPRPRRKLRRHDEAASRIRARGHARGRVLAQRRADPGQRAGASTLDPATDNAPRHRTRPDAHRAAEGRWTARPTDRVVVLHRPPGRDGPAGVTGQAHVRIRVRDLPRRARRLPDDLGVAPRHHGRDRAGLPFRATPRDRAGGGPVAT